MTVFTTSWDDGHPLDLRLAELLAKHGFTGTFYIPGRLAPGGSCNPEGLPVLAGKSLRELDSAFEIGSHTLDHSDLVSVGIEEARRQVIEGKKILEHELGHGVPGFCYPGGKYSPPVCAVVRDAGFSYARTIDDLYASVRRDPFRMPVSFQFYPRPRIEYARRLVKGGAWARRIGTTLAAVRGQDLLSSLKVAVDHACRSGGVFHLWGHSWELEKFGGWKILDEFLGYAAESVPQRSRVTNGQLAQGRDSGFATAGTGTGTATLVAIAMLGGSAPLVETQRPGPSGYVPMEASLEDKVVRRRITRGQSSRSMTDRRYRQLASPWSDAIFRT